MSNPSTPSSPKKSGTPPLSENQPPPSPSPRPPAAPTEPTTQPFSPAEKQPQQPQPFQPQPFLKITREALADITLHNHLSRLNLINDPDTIRHYDEAVERRLEIAQIEANIPESYERSTRRDRAWKPEFRAYVHRLKNRPVGLKRERDRHRDSDRKWRRDRRRYKDGEGKEKGGE